MAGDLDMGHARALLPLDGAQQILRANEIVAKKLSVREAEKLRRPARAPARRGRRRCCARNAEAARHRAARASSCPTRFAAPVEIRVQEAHGKRGEQGEVAIAFALARRAQRAARHGSATTRRVTAACAWCSQAARRNFARRASRVWRIAASTGYVISARCLLTVDASHAGAALSKTAKASLLEPLPVAQMIEA